MGIQIQNLDMTCWFNFILGRDATEDFEDAGHSNVAKEIMGAFCIGELDVDTTSPEITSKNQPVDYPQKIKDLTKQYWAVPVAVVGISVVVGFLYLRKKWFNAILPFVPLKRKPSQFWISRRIATEKTSPSFVFRISLVLGRICILWFRDLCTDYKF